MIRIYGHSDDCIEIEGDVDEELGAYSRPRCITVGGEDGGVEVWVEYAPERTKGAVWHFTIGLIDEDVPCPWPIRIEPKHGYSQQAVIDCPAGTPVDFGEEDDK